LMGARGDTRKRRKLKAKLALTEHECWLCLGYYGPLDFTLPYRHMLSVEIDEEIPFSKGGDPFDKDGTHLVHRFCNLKKGSKILPRGAFSRGVENYFSSWKQPPGSSLGSPKPAGSVAGQVFEKPRPSREW